MHLLVRNRSKMDMLSSVPQFNPKGMRYVGRWRGGVLSRRRVPSRRKKKFTDLTRGSVGLGYPNLAVDFDCLRSRFQLFGT